MTFLYPSFLFALFSLLIPILIHLLNLQKSRKVYFTNFSFLKEVDQTTKRKFKLKQLLILIMRLLALAFLVFAFAQPYIPAKNGSRVDHTNDLLLYLDNSNSMSSLDGSVNALDKGINFASEIINMSGDNAKIQLIRSKAFPEENFLISRDKAQQKLSETTISNGYRSLELVYTKSQLLTEGVQPKSHYIISDFQKSTMGKLEMIKEDTSAKVILIPINNTDQSNLYIDSLWLETPYVKKGEPNKVYIKINNTGDLDYKSVNAKFFIGDKQVSSCSQDIPSNGYSICEVTFQTEETGILPCKVRLSDDELSFDNEFYFTLEVASAINVLVVSDKASSFCYFALKNEEIFKVKKESTNNLSVSEFEKYDYIIVEHVNAFDNVLASNLLSAKEKGVHLMLFPPSNLDVGGGFKSLLSSLNISFSALAPDSGAVQPKDYLFTPDLNNPYYKGVFDEMTANVKMPYAKPVLALSKNGNVLLTRKDHQPILEVFDRKGVNCFVWAVPLQEKYTSIFRHSMFVPVLYRSTLSSSASNHRLFYNYGQDQINIFGDFTATDVPYKLKGNQFEMVANRTSASELVFDITEGDYQPGFYDVVKGDEVITKVALNIDKKESLSKYYSNEELYTEIKGFDHIEIYEATDAEDFKNMLKEVNEGVALWKKCLLLSLIFLLSEIILIRYYK